MLECKRKIEGKTPSYQFAENGFYACSCISLNEVGDMIKLCRKGLLSDVYEEEMTIPEGIELCMALQGVFRDIELKRYREGYKNWLR